MPGVKTNLAPTWSCDATASILLLGEKRSSEISEMQSVTGRSGGVGVCASVEGQGYRVEGLEVGRELGLGLQRSWRCGRYSPAGAPGSYPFHSP
eukprot:scaffold4129_cov88-Isochrysis_galbana.AAC.1